MAHMQPINLYPTEKRATASLASIFAVRMLGLFMVLPILSIYAHTLRGTTELLIGLALGSYGLTQACLQLPFGMLSDKLGRKPIITIGLSLFIIGSIVCALADSIIGLLIGRALQGTGAIGSTIIALIADLTREENRTKAMAFVGATIGLSFTVAMVLGPIMSGLIGVHGIFWLTAILAAIGIVILFTVVPKPTHSIFHREAQPLPSLLKHTFCQPDLLRLNIGIFCLHAMLTALFVVIPMLLSNTLNIDMTQQWHIYLPVLVCAFVSALPLIIIAEKKRQMKNIFLCAIVVLGISQIGLWAWHTHYLSISISLYSFFTAFTLLEASLPSLVSKLAPTASKGTAMGIYSSAQFLGIFAGGSLGGILYGYHHSHSVLLMTTLLAMIWLVIAIPMGNIPYLATFMLNVGKMSSTQADVLTDKIANIAGVADVVVIADEGVAYLKVDNTSVDHNQLLAFSHNVIDA